MATSINVTNPIIRFSRAAIERIWFSQTNFLKHITA